MTTLASNTHAAVETTDTEELRNRTRQEALDRERQQQAPSVNLQGKVPKVAPAQLPVSETPCFTVHHFVLEVPAKLSPAAKKYGASTSYWDTFRFAQDYLEQFTGQCLGREGINFIVRGVSAKILERGYSTTRVGIPEQDMLSGILKLTLVPGIIHELRFADPATAGIWKNAFPTSAGKLLNLRDLEQGLEQMKRVTSQEVDIQIVPAGDLGESDIVISVKRSKPWKAIINLDDSGASGTGKMQAGLQLGWDNLFNANDLLNIGTGSDADRNSYQRGTQGYNFSYSVPYGYWTTTVSANDYTYHQRIMGAVQTFVSSGKSQSYEAKVNYLFHRDQFSKSSLQFRTAKRASHSYIDDTEVEVQKRDTTLAELALIHKHNIGEAQIDTTLAYRWGAPWFGAQTEPSGLPATSPRYRYKLETLDISVVLPFKVNEHPYSYSATFRAQNTNTALYASEWFAIGNRWTVRGFDGESSLGAEKGFFLRNEIGIPIMGTAQSAYVGVDFGEVYGENTANLLGNKLAGIAVGLKGSLAKGLMYEAFAGWSLYKPQNYRTQEPAAGFSLTYQM
ncbi:MAG: ShlB/FhaC/HecB family hemolysin secretion/activation protein [Gammaproteobacteria bacterium]|nr:ShlB/FhaC/HecB family hemolysin secretion/activation protein [Gammaproteobacteria bacterium]MBU1482678.1 ShlB/FhaC/HecB family hemolysin secretion/activation protein [Gammaproteobacteria bacterium]